MIIDIFMAAAISAAIILLLWLLRGVMLTPVKKGKNQKLTVTLRVTGPSPELESTVDGLLWLIRNGTLPAEIIIEDAGMDSETRQAAELLCSRGAIINIR
ncbi:MAG TPA: hypothetical protein GXZ52_08525 [Clostridiales bacterium]|nr:hypothetical protein [Clostridiales bacterium]